MSKLSRMSKGSFSCNLGFKAPRINGLLLILLMLPQLSMLHQRHSDTSKSYIPENIKREILDHQDIATQIIDYVTGGPGKSQAYNRLAKFVDTFGSRIAGSQNLENAIDFMLEKLKDDGLENVHGEEVSVIHWVRGKESVQMILPRNYSMAVLGLGGSISTAPEGITAEVLVVKSFDDLESKGSLVKGKIVVFNEDWVSYGTTVAYRDYAAARTAKLGGLASLIRSVTPYSIYSPHTGWQDYQNGVEKIPTACITVEDAEMMARMAARGTKIVLNLKMEAKTLPDATSRNTVAEIVGSKYPEQVVLVSGHLDSWDVGQGAMDDGGGAFISWQALSVIRRLNLRPKRTLRVVLWTGEEEGLLGSNQYYNRHKGDISNFDLVMESDEGVFMPFGLLFQGNDQAGKIMQDVMKLLGKINATTLVNSTVGGDIGFWTKKGVPGGSLANHNEKYFYYHHSNGDTMTVQDPDVMDLCTAVWAVVAYTVADLEEMLPR